MRPKDQDDVSLYNSTAQNYQFYLSCLQFQLIKQQGGAKQEVINHYYCYHRHFKNCY